MRFHLMLFLSLASLSLTAQHENSSGIHIDERLLEAYDQSYLEQLKNKNPILLLRWNYYLDHAFYLTDELKYEPGDSIKQVKIKNIEKINIILLEREQKLTRNWDRYSVYRINSSDQYLVYFPGKEFTEKLKAHLRTNRTN